MDLVIKNCKIASSRGLWECGLGIDDGKIVSISKDHLLPAADRVINCNGRIILPGGIDFHVHFQDPGYTYREDWKTGTGSAAAGGTTLVVDHGNTNPPSTTPKNLMRIIKTAERKAIVDFGINGAVTSKNLNHLPKLAAKGVMAFGEIYMAESVPELERVEDGILLEAFKIIGKMGCIAGVHAENWEIVSHFTQKLKQAKRKDPLAHCESRPDIAEAEAISRALLFGRETGVRLHIFHLSTGLGTNILRQARSLGQDVSAEVLPQHLLFRQADMKKLGPYLKCNPPIRSEANRVALWEGLKTGVIEMVSSDHWPMPLSEVEAGWEDIWKAGSGIAGVETRLPLLLTYGVKKNLISMEKFVRITSENPARKLGLYPRKGSISIGADADLTIVDMKKKVKIKIDNLRTKAGYTPFENWTVVGIPWLTLVRGEIVFEEGEIVAKPGHGRYIQRDYGKKEEHGASKKI
ncbi:MAG: dihydroorotase [Candidatus Hadarchaeum sp.]|uniref:dihydroorotase n=2 Tax=Candidatus Hadarchaeum sp. TaxID=2883567 RepID=UPI003178BB22